MEVVMRYRVDCQFDVMDYEMHKMGGKRLRFVYLFCVSPVQNISNYYMAESACGKIKRILCFNWLPEWAIWDFAGFPTLELQENSLSCDKFFTDQVSVVKTTGC